MARTNAQQQLRTAVDGLDSDPLSKANGAGNGNNGEDDDDDDDEEALKSLPDEDDLRKAMFDLSETVTAAENGQSVRQADLAQRLADGDDLTKSERDELTHSLSGEAGEDGSDFGKSHRETFSDDPTIVEGWEMSPYLDSRDTALCKSLDNIASAIQSTAIESDAKTARLAKGLHAAGSAVVRLLHRVNQLEKSLESVGAQPRAPRAVTRVGQPFAEGDARQTPANDPLNKSQGGGEGGWVPNAPDLKRGLTALIKSTEPNGANAAEGFGVFQGTDLVIEQAKLEQTGQVSSRIMPAILTQIGVDPKSLGLPS